MISFISRGILRDIVFVWNMRRDFETRFKPQPNSLASAALSTKVDKQTDQVVRSLPNRSEWLRRVITEAARRELMSDSLGVAIVEGSKQLEDSSTPGDNPDHKVNIGGE